MKRLSYYLILLLFTLSASAQNYHAIKGSSYAGSLGIANNPASITGTPFPWDINLLSFQVTSATNAFTVVNYSLLSNPALSLYRVNKGNYDRYIKGNINLHLFNMRLALNRRQAIAFGMNVRAYPSGTTGTFNYIDSVKTFTSFLKINENNPVLTADIKNSSWMEVFGTYSQTLLDDEISRLNGGVTLKVMRSLAGFSGSLQNIVLRRVPQRPQPAYLLQNGNLQYGYSANMDNWKKGNSAIRNLEGLLHNAPMSIAADFGMEYLVKSQAITNFTDDDDFYDYEWKIGVSLLDLGSNKYNYSPQSRTVNSPKINIGDSLLMKKFKSVHNVRQFNDSLATIADQMTGVSGKFRMVNPTRLVLNADRNLHHNFYVNADLSLNLSPLAGSGSLYVTELSVVTVTPRWETRRLGIYLPVQYNALQQFLVGGAFKAGPLLAGVHNLSSIFAKNKVQNGGGYLALVIRPSMLTRAYRDKRFECP